MGFRQGKSGNPNGRPRGARGRVPQAVKSWLAEIIAGRRGQIEADLDSLQPLERLRMLELFMRYVIPKAKQEVDITTNGQAVGESRYADMPRDLLYNVADFIQNELGKMGAENAITD